MAVYGVKVESVRYQMSDKNNPKPARYQYVAAAFIGGFTALLGVLMLVASAFLFINGKPHAWKASGFGMFFLLLAVLRTWSILRARRNTVE